MIRETFPVGVLGCNCTILGDEASREAIVVDPGADLATILWVLARYGLTVRRIVVTHAHIDHIAGAAELKAITGAPVVYNQADLPLVALMGEQAGWIGVAEPEVRPPDHSPADAEHIAVAGVDATVFFNPRAHAREPVPPFAGREAAAFRGHAVSGLRGEDRSARRRSRPDARQHPRTAAPAAGRHAGRARAWACDDDWGRAPVESFSFVGVLLSAASSSLERNLCTSFTLEGLQAEVWIRWAGGRCPPPRPPVE